MASPKEMFEQFLTVFKEFSLLQKLIAALVVAGVLGGMLMLSVGGGKTTNYQVLYSSLNQEDASEVVAKLKEQLIPYELDMNGTVVKVPADKVLETRLSLAGDGLPRGGGGVGFEIFDKTNFGTTDFVQKMNYQRALQGELARTIRQFQQVQEARVHIAAPTESVFIEEKKPPSASVSVKLRGNNQLEQKQIQAIVNLVASSVQGLTDENITIVDTAGRLLFRKRGGEMGQMTDSQLEYQQSMEKGLRDKLETMFEQVVGTGKAIARVSLELDFNQTDTTEEMFDPEGQVVRSEQLLNEDSTQPGPNAQGIPGVKGNLATYNEAGEGGAAGNASAKRNNVTRNYEVSKTVKRVKNSMGKIKRLSVAVMVDGTYEKSVDKEGKSTIKYIQRTADDLKWYEKMARNAVGFDPERGDQLEVVGTSFAASLEPEVKADPMERWQQLIERMGQPVIYLLVAICFVFFVVRPFFRLLSQKQLEEQRRLMMASKPHAKEEPEAVEEDLSLKPVGMSDKEKIYRLAQTDPDRAADLVRRWLRQEA